MNMMNDNVDTLEIEKFTQLAQQWWDPKGKLKTLHAINPPRTQFIAKHVNLSGMKVLDLGCGGGILSESLAKSGAHVTGIDMDAAAINIAKAHMADNNLSIDYHCTSAESLAEQMPQQFDVITCMELLEHVPQPESIISACAALIKPHGHLFFSTLNRHLKSYLLAIIGAEYLLRIIPTGTHDYSRFIKPSELTQWARKSQLHCRDIQGMHYNPLTNTASLSKDCRVNYLAYYQPL